MNKTKIEQIMSLTNRFQQLYVRYYLQYVLNMLPNVGVMWIGILSI